jgi:pyruvate/2-oxoglutarate dehydrogenase complex dihydrolipoamide dehydrogenase (E3) component
MVKPYLRFFGPRTLGWLTKFWLPIGKRVIVIGGGLHGCETAEFLAKRGRKVTIVEQSEAIGEGVLDFRLGLLLDWFPRKGVTIISGVKDMEITDEGLVITTKDGKKQTLEANSIIPTAPLKPNDELAKSLKGKVPEIYIIGDCGEPRMIVNAIADGYHTARTI